MPENERFHVLIMGAGQAAIPLAHDLAKARAALQLVDYSAPRDTISRGPVRDDQSQWGGDFTVTSIEQKYHEITSIRVVLGAKDHHLRGEQNS